MKQKHALALALGDALKNYILDDVKGGETLPDALENAFCFVCVFVEVNGLSEKQMHEALSVCVRMMEEQRRSS